MKYHFLLVLIMMLRVGFAASADDSVKDGWQLMASHVNGFIPKTDKDSKGAALERTVFLWLYVKKCTQSPRRFPTRGLSNDHNPEGCVSLAETRPLLNKPGCGGR
jgi:hypothetical protein